MQKATTVNISIKLSKKFRLEKIQKSFEREDVNANS